jgi:hypothetical protein
MDIQQERIAGLRAQHAVLETRLQAELAHPMPNPATMLRIQQEKHRLREAMERLSAAPPPAAVHDRHGTA